MAENIGEQLFGRSWKTVAGEGRIWMSMHEEFECWAFEAFDRSRIGRWWTITSTIAENTDFLSVLWWKFDVWTRQLWTSSSQGIVAECISNRTNLVWNIAERLIGISSMEFMDPSPFIEVENIFPKEKKESESRKTFVLGWWTDCRLICLVDIVVGTVVVVVSSEVGFVLLRGVGRDTQLLM